jgi:hypothetical protein
MEVSGKFHAPAALTPGEGAPGTHWIGGWVGPDAGPDDVEKWKLLPPPGLELWPLVRPASSQSLYRLRYYNENQILYAYNWETNVFEQLHIIFQFIPPTMEMREHHLLLET